MACTAVRAKETPAPNTNATLDEPAVPLPTNRPRRSSLNHISRSRGKLLSYRNSFPDPDHIRDGTGPRTDMTHEERTGDHVARDTRHRAPTSPIYRVP